MPARPRRRDRSGGAHRRRRKPFVVKLVLKAPSGPLGPLIQRFLPAGDLIMMRKQLLTLMELAERDADESRLGAMDVSTSGRSGAIRRQDG
jgi:hypothetical protein